MELEVSPVETLDANLVAIPLGGGQRFFSRLANLAGGTFSPGL
jgi:hypothetical protein